MGQCRQCLPGALAIAGMAVVFLPVLPGLLPLAQGLELAVWRGLLADAQTLVALRVTVISSVVSTLLALLLALLLTMALYPGPRWPALQRRLPALLAMPHAAFAIGAFFLLAPSGWLARWLAPLAGWDVPPDWQTVRDPYGLSLGLLLAVKEAIFLLWMLAAVLQEGALQRQMTLARSLGYGRWQVWWLCLLPQVLPRLGWPLLAVLAYGVSVVDVALILGPGSPPSLAVLAWRWLADPELALQARGAAASWLLLLVFLLLCGCGLLLWRLLRAAWRQPHGRRWAGASWQPRWLAWPLLGFCYLLALALLLWSLAGPWFFPAALPQSWTLAGWQQLDTAPLFTSLGLGLASAGIGLALVLLWLECGPPALSRWLYLPLILPALPLAAGQYHALLMAGLAGSGFGVVWSHLLWVVPYMLLTLYKPYLEFDTRMITLARSLGLSHWQRCWRIKWPLLLRPILAALAIGFAVSIAQYLPTLFAGGGRFATVTTEAVALSSGGNRRVLAVQAMLQLVLPMLMFALATLLGQWAGRHRQGWR